MSCYKHSEREAVAQCSDCGKQLCADCANSFTPPLCVDCALTRAGEIKGELTKNILLSVVLMVVGIFVIKSPAGILLAGIPYGWAVLNRITPNMFLWMSWIGWLIYFIIKLVLAYFIGLIALPIKLFKWISELVRINRTISQI